MLWKQLKLLPLWVDIHDALISELYKCALYTSYLNVIVPHLINFNTISKTSLCSYERTKIETSEIEINIVYSPSQSKTFRNWETFLLQIGQALELDTILSEHVSQVLACPHGIKVKVPFLGLKQTAQSFDRFGKPCSTVFSWIILTIFLWFFSIAISNAVWLLTFLMIV